jgi:hypothetical protein
MLLMHTMLGNSDHQSPGAENVSSASKERTSAVRGTASQKTSI